MLRQLRVHLTLISIFITGMILSIICLFALQISEDQLDQRNHIAFQSHLNTIAYHLQYNQVISNSWLAQIESDNQLVIAIEDNGHPFLFKGSWTPSSDRKTLIDMAKSTALKNYQLDPSYPTSSTLKINKAFFSLHGTKGDYYRAAVAIVPTPRGTYTLTLLQDMKNETASIIHTRILFVSISFLGILLLALFSWWFAGRAILPIEVNQRKQVEFISAASHELKSPLAVIQSSSSALENQDPLSQLRFIHTIQKECTRMARLVDDLLLLATADAKTWTIHKSPTAIDTLLIDMLDLFLPLAHSKGQSISLLLPDSMTEPVWCDAERIQQAISILLDNALSYVPQGGKITLSLDTDEAATTLKVIDNGPGISPDHKTHIFDRFYRVDTSRQDKSHYGLGLSIASEIIRLHTGSITLQDTPGGGCTFVINLPVEQGI
ncbi:MAG: HAMP domain-containing sensor histidine kinase [Cellulosilyticaceae bacterium]